MKIIIVGAPGAGKGTQSKIISQHLGIPHISTGDMLRDVKEDGTERGNYIKNLIDDGKFVSDELIIELVKERVSQPDCAKGFILDGFPRTVAQAKAMKDVGIDVEHVLEIDVPDNCLIERITGRLIHEPSGRVYHRSFNKPVVEGKDDVTGEPLTQREDDKESIVVERIATYHKKTKPVLDFYMDLVKVDSSVQYHVIDGTADVEDIPNQIYAHLAA